MIEDLRKELDDIDLLFQQQEMALADSRAYAEMLERKLAEAGIKAPLPPPPPLKVFDTYKDIVWERWPVEALNRPEFSDLAMRYSMGFIPKEQRESGEFMPYRNVIVKQYGELTNVEVRQMTGVQQDFEKICNRRAMDVTVKNMAGIVQSGDDGFESDVTDIEFLCRNYQGGLNYPLSTWRGDYQKYAQILAAARPDLVGEWEAHRFSVAPVPGAIT